MPLNNFDAVIPGAMYRSGALDARAIATLATLPVQLIMQLNPTDDPGEAAAVEACGMVHVIHDVPAWTSPVAALVENLRAAAAQMDEWVREGIIFLVHCAAGRDRTGSVVAAWRILYCHYSFEQADAERRLYGSEFILEVVDAVIAAALRLLEADRKPVAA